MFKRLVFSRGNVNFGIRLTFSTNDSKTARVVLEGATSRI